MDENEKISDGLEAENTEELQSSNDQSELEKELENIRDMFQKELDGNNESYTTVDGEPLIQSLEDMGLEVDENNFDVHENADTANEEEHEEIAEEDLCEYCGKNRRDTSFGEDYPYCTECREKMKKNPFNAIAAIVTLVIIAVAGLTLGFMAKDMESYSALLNAQEAYNTSKLGTAISSYEQYLSSIDPTGSYSKTAIKNYIKCFDSLGYISNSVQAINQFYTEEDLQKKKNADILDITQRSEKLNATAVYIEENYYDILEGIDFDYKKAIKDVNKAIKDNLKSDKYDQTYLEFLKYIIMFTNGDSNTDRLNQLIKVRETDIENGEKTTWLYITHLISSYAKEGDSEKAKECFDIAMNLNSQDLACYASYSDVYRFAINKKSSKEDIAAAGDKILEIAEEAASNHEPAMTYPTYFRIYAMGYLLKGEYDMAKENMDNFIQNCSGASTTADLELYAACSLAIKDKDTYKNIAGYLESQGFELSKNLQKYAKGKIDLLTLITDKEGNI